MAKLKFPSLQHMARHWDATPDRVKKSLVNLATNPPTFSYKPLFSGIRDVIQFGKSFDEIAEGISRSEKREHVRDRLLSILPLAESYFANIAAKSVLSVAPHRYVISQELLIPFEPPFVYIQDETLFLPWLSFWKGNPLAGKRLSLFATIAREIISQEPDLENAVFSILDFSAPSSKEPRSLKIIMAESIPSLSEEEKKEMLGVFAEGYRLAKQELEGQPETAPKEKEKDNRDTDGDQYPLFGSDF